MDLDDTSEEAVVRDEIRAGEPGAAGVNVPGDDVFLEKLMSFVGREFAESDAGHDPVNEPMIRHWCEAIGDENPIYTDPAAAAASIHGGNVAPPAMLQAWVMHGLKPLPPSGGSAQDELFDLLDSAGYTSVVATNYEQHYERYLTPGDYLSETKVIEWISELKQTALGAGHFFTVLSMCRDQTGELVGTTRFRALKFRPTTREPEVARPARPRPTVTEDDAWWFEACRRHELFIQRCAKCGTLRHPVAPACGTCQSFDWDTVEASGRGALYSFVVNHHPQVPGFDYPLPIGLIELEEGTRLVANLVEVDPSLLSVGMPVEVIFVDHDDALTLPAFRPAD